MILVLPTHKLRNGWRLHLNRIILGLVIVMGLITIMINPISANIHETKSYDIEYVFNDSGDKIKGVKLYINDVQLRGANNWSIISCYSGSDYGSSCQIIMMEQNEKLIKQNDKIIELLEGIKSNGS